MIWRPLDWLATWLFVWIVKYFAWRVSRSVKFQPLFMYIPSPGEVPVPPVQKEKMN